ncbi:MAG: hypothetical protein ACOVN5_00350, partial [Aquidulcibacter sp.]
WLRENQSQLRGEGFLPRAIASHCSTSHAGMPHSHTVHTVAPSESLSISALFSGLARQAFHTAHDT